MSAFIQWMTQFFGAWKPWLVVKPWEIGIRIRLGKTAKTLQPGFHLRIPLLDQMQVVNTRVRIVSTPTVSLANETKGFASVRTAVVSFRLSDPLLAMMTYTDPEGVVSGQTQAEMSKGLNAEECQAALSGLAGIDVSYLQFVENVEVRTIRLLQSQSYATSAHQEKEKY